MKQITWTLLITLVASQQYSISQCVCSQLLSEGDCTKVNTIKCKWDLTKKICQNSDDSVNPIIKYTKYCDNFSEFDCPKLKPCSNCGSYAACAWVEDCTAFAKTTDSECQSISNRCITDGIHCVEIDTCDKYKKQQPCVKNIQGGLCYWDQTNNSCVDANTCDKLPLKFITDKECRDVIQNCTTKSGGGCVDSGNNCSDQKLESQCVWDKLQTMACYWNGTECKDRICDNAPSSLNTDDACKLFRLDGSCTTKENGGCITRTTCQAAKISASCVKNSTNDDCYWNGNACVDKTCANAPLTNTTNLSCASFVKGCITKQGGGCVANGDCSAANISQACVKNQDNIDCIWDSTCKEKTCENAPKTNTTHEQCSLYLQTCTVQSGGGCQKRTCSNAPTSLTSNETCEAYLPGNKCITKNGGGCVVNTTCALINIEIACLQNSLGQTCFWHSVSGSCKDKTCVNAPSTNNTHELCQSFLNTCTVNSTYSGCVEKTCENSLTMNICDKDINNKLCIWKAKCYKKQCALAPSSLVTHEDCQKYHSSCILNNTGQGCVTIPLKCEAITLESACKIKANKQICGWANKQCIDKNCSTAPKTISTTSDCQNYLTPCVANNPITVNGISTIQGCQDLPKTCDLRKSSENCNISRTGFPICYWDQSSNKCVEKSCLTASLVGTPGALSNGQFTYTNCQDYFSTCVTTDASGNCTQTSKPCISTNNQDGCMVRPTSCQNLVQQNCYSKINGDCFWNGSSCVDKVCSNIILTSHKDCNQKFNQCTVNDNGTACIPLASTCGSYTIDENCKITSTFKNCYWTGSVCRNAICDDTPDSNLFDSDEECLNYQTQNETCTIIAKVGAQGCVQKQAICSNYKTQSQCHKTITNLTNEDDCKWINERCYSMSQFATGACSTFKGTQSMCQAYRQGCTNVANASTSTACTLDCTLKVGSSLKFQDCQAVDPTCSVKKDGTGCIVIQSTCTGYGTTAVNCYRSSAAGTQANCIMNSESTPSCQAVTSGSQCTLLNGLNGLNHGKCQEYNIACTSVKDGTGCQEFKAKCNDYAGNTDNCTVSQQGRCYFDGTDCIRFSNCSSIVGSNLTDQICLTYNSSCTVNQAGTRCQEKKAKCDLYPSKESCSFSNEAATQKCVWSGTACIAVTIVATQCIYVTGTNMSDTLCQTYNANCTVNYEKTGCQEKKSSCGQYSTQSSCTISSAAGSAGKCVWYGGECRIITQLSKICEAVKGSYLTDAKCGQYNSGCTTTKTGFGCQVKMPSCSLYTEESYCSISSASGTSANCFWSNSSCISIETGPQCELVIGYGLTDEQCAAYNAKCQSNLGHGACQEKLATCADYKSEKNCSKSKASGTQSYCIWYNSACTYITDPATQCQKVVNSFLTNEDYCLQYHAQCVPNFLRNSCMQIQSTCGSYNKKDNCYKSSSGYCAWIDDVCRSLTDSSECSKVTGTTLTNNYCSGLNSLCWAYGNGEGCFELKAQCSSYGNEAQSCIRTLTPGNAGLCPWSSGTEGCFQLTTASQCDTLRIVTSFSTGTTDALCSAYNQACIAKQRKDDCQLLRSNCSEYTFDKCFKVGTQGNTVNCYYSGSSCAQVTNISTDCAKITGGSLTDAICAAYHAGCTVNSDNTACQERKAVCANYTTVATCTFSSASSPYNNCIFLNSNCVPGKDMLTDCAAITASSGLTDTICASYNPTCTTNKTGTVCQDKKGSCSDYQNQNQCTVSSGSGTASKCIWTTSCITITNVATECGFITGTNLTDATCATYNNGCTVNNQGTACQEKKSTCADYTQNNQCTRSQDPGQQSYCVWHSTSCMSIQNAETECSYVTGTNLTNDICANYNPDCTANSSGNACQIKKSTCADYTSKDSCSTSADGGNAAFCIWNGTSACTSVQDVTTQCILVTGKTGLDLSKCQLYNHDCANLKDGTGCQEAKSACKDYTTQNQCTVQNDGTSCLWYENYCYVITAATCDAITGTDLTHEQCQAYNIGCTQVGDGTSCQDLKTTCEQYTGTTTTCTKSVNAKCYLQNSNTCITISNVSTDCAKITGSAETISYDLCQSYNTGCSVNRTKTACVQKAAQCSGYSNSMPSCYQSDQGFCSASNSSDQACVPVSSISSCDSLYLGSGNYSDANCSAMKPECTANGTSSCTARTCANAKDFVFNHKNCFTWLKTCTVNLSNSGCTPMAAKCSDQQSTQCLNAIEGECLNFNSICIRKGCDTAPEDSAHDDDTECSNYSQLCTVARAGGCQIRSACQQYKSSLQCKLDNKNNKCFWNPSIKTCVDLSCQNVEATNLYNSHAKCVAVDSTLACTVRAQNKIAIPGCMARGPCSSYTIQDQCRTNSSGIDCVWNTNPNLSEPACQDKSCVTAPISITTHNGCQLYYNTPTIKCTVFASPSNDGGLPTLGGCQQTAACSSYLDSEQCKINAAGEPCGWNGKECNDKSCSTAPKTSEYDDDTKCRAYFDNKCTVSSEGQGCVEIPEICELMNQKQCYFNRAGQPCFWSGTDCVTRTCENAPEETATAEECNNYLDGCTIDVVKCKIKICEDFALATDALCSQALPTCTSNGINCVARGSCYQAQSQAGCVVSSTGEFCEWVPAVMDSQNNIVNPASCTVKTCNTAPNTIMTDAECGSYFKNCTIKSGGGCVIKSTCSAAKVNAACTTALNGTICAWDYGQNNCRDKDCQDFLGTTHAICQSQRKGCTVGINGRCATVQNCEQTMVREACIEGINGPCLWIEKYPNSDGSKGACFSYTSCKSQLWSNDESCKWISDKCTTNGSNCIGITLCSETNTNGGCVTGYDGSCIQSVPSLNSSDPKVCQPYKSCTDAYYSTHQDCQTANINCTTDGTTGCIPLGACSTYKSQPGCQINNTGPVVKSGSITSTGQCTWDGSTSTCRDQVCTDLNGQNHTICNQQLSTCTSDGAKCLLKQTCSNYVTQIICTTAVGSDGSCFWEIASTSNNNTPKCRLLSCSDIQNGTSTNACQNVLSSCISDGTSCIPKAKSCNTGGLDGLCIFTQSTVSKDIANTGTCSLMTQCSSANNDESACLAAKDRCSWTPATGTGTTAVNSKCTNHTCASYYSLVGNCSRFFNWDKQSQQICILKDGICTSVDPSTLIQKDCFNVSGYTYTWNDSTNKCQLCTKTVQPNDTVNNSINNTNNNSNTDSGLQLASLTMILGFLIF